MIRSIGLALVLSAVIPTVQPGETTTETWTGWFSDKQCARVKDGEAPKPNGTACVKKCLDEGAQAVFISEQAKAVFDVRDYPSAKEDVGWYLQITGEVDAKAKTVSVKSVKRLSEVAQTCAIPKKPGKQ